MFRRLGEMVALGGGEEFALGYIWPWMMGCGAYGALEIGLGGGE